MRSARLPAACALLALTVGPAALDTAPAFAADATPITTPTATATAETPSGSPSPTAKSSETPSATATPSATPTATGSPWPYDRPEGPMASPMPVTGSSDTPGELTVTFDNVSTTTVMELATTVTLTGSGSLAVELRAPGGSWKPLTVSGIPTDTGTYQLAQGQKLTLRLRAAAGAPLGDHRLTFTGKSEVLPIGSAPAKKYNCPQLAGSYTGTMSVGDRTATPGPTAAPTTAPGHLADTGAGTATRPLAIAGTTAVLLGAALLLTTRRRTHT
ncbi:LPXTG cell wall anchor domain-containing protein [Kitasatospora sp. NPDC059803]|uniref:LPXTG cell wall anchor domain-containing protein n=1 Tax=Kitasatospora sp. NPDC059803 TaxID=3346953 RepID=UPI00364B4967